MSWHLVFVFFAHYKIPKKRIRSNKWIINYLLNMMSGVEVWRTVTLDYIKGRRSKRAGFPWWEGRGRISPVSSPHPGGVQKKTGSEKGDRQNNSQNMQVIWVRLGLHTFPESQKASPSFSQTFVASKWLWVVFGAHGWKRREEKRVNTSSVLHSLDWS